MARATIQSFCPRITPEEAGLSSVQVEKFIAFLQDNHLNPHAFVISRYGKVFAEAYFAPYDPYELQTVYSLSKSFTSSAVGLAIEEGKLSLDDRVVSFFGKEELPPVVDEKLQKLTVRDLLCMGTGQEKEARGGENWARTFLAEPIKDEKPGVVFRYNSMATYMCAAILQKIGIDVEVYIKEKLLHPLGIYGTRWQRSPQNVVTGGWGLSLVPELIVKFGNVLLNGGMYEGRQLLPKAYLEMATQKQIDNSLGTPKEKQPFSDSAQGYGFQFWRCRYNCFRGDGAYGQYCLVSPDTGVVFAATNQTNNMQKILDGFFELILLPLQKEALPEDKQAYAHLKESTKNLSALQAVYPFVENKKMEKEMQNLCLRLVKDPERSLLFSSVSFSFTEDGLTLILDGSPVLCGKGQYVFSSTSLPRFSNKGFDDLKTFGSYTFTGDTLLVQFGMPELLLDIRAKITLQGEKAIVAFCNLSDEGEFLWEAVKA